MTFKAKLEGYDDFKARVDSLPTRNDKTIDLASNSINLLTFNELSEPKIKLLSIDVKQGQKIFLYIKTKQGNGYISKELESGEHRYNKRYDIVSPIYLSNDYVYHNEKYIWNSLSDNSFIFFFKPVKDIAFTFNGSASTNDKLEAYGGLLGAAGKDYFHETISYSLDESIEGYLSNAIIPGAFPLEVPYITGT